jgi:hypothetical protein
MSTLTKTRRMPVKICVHPGGTTEIFYSINHPAPAREEAWPAFSGGTARLHGEPGQQSVMTNTVKN